MIFYESVEFYILKVSSDWNVELLTVLPI